MMHIDTLYNANNKLYDYPVPNAKRPMWRVADQIRVYHEDGTYTVAFMYGEKHFTYDEAERAAKRAEDKARIADNKRRKLLLEKLNALSTDDLQVLVETLFN